LRNFDNCVNDRLAVMWSITRLPSYTITKFSSGTLLMTEKVHVLNFLSDRRVAELNAESELERRARQIGTLAGRAVALLRQAQATFRDPETWNNLRGSAGDRAGEMREEAARRTQEWRRQAENSYQQARERAREAVRDYPVHAAVAAGVAGFIVGAALRIRRTYRAH
jgi:ElaB/YqjD/DUF883 family membrane-anchored ribosome-binding protein